MAATISELVDALWVVHGKEPKGCQAVADELCTRFPNKSRFQIHARCFKHDMHDTLVPYLKEKPCTPPSDSTDKVIDRRIFSGNADYTDHLESCYYALQAQYAVLRQAAEGMAASICDQCSKQGCHCLEGNEDLHECAFCQLEISFKAYRAATGKGREDE